jgi:hypothetical protein
VRRFPAAEEAFSSWPGKIALDLLTFKVQGIAEDISGRLQDTSVTRHKAPST